MFIRNHRRHFDDEKTKEIINEIHSVLSLKREMGGFSPKRNWDQSFKTTFDP
jgi:hypothetical protein